MNFARTLAAVAILALPFGTLDAQQLLGIGFFGGSSQVNVGRVDSVTGATNVLVTTDATGISSAQAAIDVTGHIFFQVPNQLYTINLNTNTSSKIAFSNCCSPLLYDPLANQLLGIGFFAGSSQVNIARIDPATGAASVLVTTDATGISSAQATIDVAGRRIFFEVPNELYSINLNTNTFSKIPFSGCCAPLLYEASAPNAIPAVGARGLFLTVLLLAALGLFFLRESP
jgi:hypothetical protein